MSTPILRPQWRLRDGKPVCAWCQAEAGEQPMPGESHGICERHREEMLRDVRPLTDAQRARLQAKVREVYHGHRPDQVEFSAFALFCCFAAGFLAALAVWLWRVL